MTFLERYLAVLDGRAVDFLPRLPILMQYAAEYIGSNYGAFASDHAVLVESNRVCARDFGFEQLSVISDPYRETQGFGGAVVYVRDGVPALPEAAARGQQGLGCAAPPQSSRSRADARQGGCGSVIP